MSRPGPSPVLIIGALALTVALAGTAIAAPDLATRDVTKKQVKKIAKKQANKVLNKREGSLNVNSAKTAGSAAPSGPAGGDLTGTYPNPLIGDAKVTTNKIADAAVTNPKIAANAVTTANIADNAVTTNKIANAAVTSPKIAANSVRASQLGPTQLAVNTVNIAANGTGAVAATCPAGTGVLSGGGTTSSFGVHMVTTFQAGNGWIVAYQNTTAAQQTITAVATCLSA